MTDLVSPAVFALATFYGPRYMRLELAQQTALAFDVVDMVQTEGFSPIMRAVEALDRRIWNKLESYATTLVAGKH